MSLSCSTAALRDRLVCGLRAAAPRDVLPTPMGIALRAGAMHEWLGCAGVRGGDWTPPLILLADLAARGLGSTRAARVLWIGRRCWPWPVFLQRSPALLDRSCFVDPPDAPSSVWAADVALRGAAPVIVVADGRGVSMAHSRRLQLAAAEHGSICLLARPTDEERELTAAWTRWRTEPQGGPVPGWRVTLLRNKDDGQLTCRRPSWVVEWNDASGAVNLSAAVADRAGDSPATRVGAA